MTEENNPKDFKKRENMLNDLRKLRGFMEDKPQFASVIVGLDYFGNEHMRPYCPFIPDEFLEFLVEMRAQRKGRFGFRYHCGEWDQNFDGVQNKLLAHMTVSSRVIRRVLQYVVENEKGHHLTCPLRIGHGVAFRHWFGPPSSEEADPRRIELHMEIAETLALMRDYEVPIEINLTSNQVLVEFEPGFHHELLKEGFCLVLCTDNHGIWNCSQVIQDDGTYRFPSIAGEYYAALKNLRSPNSQHLLMANSVVTLVLNGWRAAFDRPSSFINRFKKVFDALTTKSYGRTAREGKWWVTVGRSLDSSNFD